MFNLFGKKRSVPFDQLVAGVQPAIDARDEAHFIALAEEIIDRIEENPQKVEAVLGWAILVACEFQWACTSDLVGWFIGRFPDSISPVKVEMAVFLAESGRPDAGTQLAREYLRVVRDGGYLPRLADMPIARRGAAKAFLALTAATTHAGARAYSRRVLAHAKTLGVPPEFPAIYDAEIARLDTELADPANASQNDLWEAFFATGAHADVLHRVCLALDCPMLARRVDLIEGRFRFDAGSRYRVGIDEIFELVMQAEAGGNPVTMLA